VSTTVYFISTPSAPRSIAKTSMLCVLVPGFEKTVTALFFKKMRRRFYSKQRHVEAMIEESASRKTQNDPKEPFAVGWRSM